MATSSISPFPSPNTFTPGDAALAARYAGDMSVNGRMAIMFMSETQFIFGRLDGHSDAYSGEDLKAARWWRLLSPRTVVTIESWLYDDGPVGTDLPVCYVARSDRKAGGRLVAGTRMSPYFQGDKRTDVGRAACSEIRKSCPDAGLFYARCVEDAERSLSGVDVHAERLEQRSQAIRAEQAAVRELLKLAA